MTAPAARPDADTLRKYNRGLLSPREVAAVEAWMAENSQAADLLDEASGCDSVIDALNDTGASGNTPAATNVQQVRPKPEMALPDAIGGYRVLRELGRGGMGVVYEAVDTHLKRRVAVKLIAAELAANAAARERFLREAQAVARIDHPNVVPVHSSGEDRGQLFLVMPLLKGETLESRLKRERKLPPAEVARIGREVAAGLEAAHAVGLIHRDIKPGNIWLEADTGRVRILDFGLAKPLTDAEAGLTETGVIVGTPHYMAPEQAEGHSVDSRTDLFSLGAVLYHAATGERPFRGQTSLAVLIAVKADTPPSVETLSPDLPPHLASVIHKLLAKTAADRPTSATEVIESLSGVTTVPASPFALDDSPEIVRPKHALVKKLPTRWKRAATAAGLVFAALALVAGIVVIIRDKDGKEVARITVPEGGKVEIQPSENDKAPKPAVADPDRKAAEWVLATGGNIILDGRAHVLAGPLPKAPFRLTSVNWDKRTNVTDADLAVLKDCKHVARFQLTGTSVTDAGMANFKEWTQLTELSLNETRVSDDGYASFKDCTNLVSLSLARLDILPQATDAGVAHFRNCKKLKNLNLAYQQRLSDTAVAYFKDCAELEYLNLHGCKRITDASLFQIRNYLQLRDLNLTNTQVTDVGVEHLKGSKNLTELSLVGTRVTEAKVKELAKAMPWCWIAWGEVPIEPTAPDRRAAHQVLIAGGTVRVNGEARDIKAFADLPPGDFRLTHVDLKRCRFDDRFTTSFQNCKHVTYLDLSFTEVNDADLKHFRNCSDLTVLLLERCAKVTDAALPQMKEYPKLRVLVLLAVPITDAGVEPLKECKSLRDLWVNNPKVTAGKVQALRKALPKCRIVGNDGSHDPLEKD